MIDPTHPDGRTPIHPARAVVTGGIRWSDRALIDQALDLCWRPAKAAGGSFRVLTGMAPGVDAHARAWTTLPPQRDRVHLFAEPLAPEGAGDQTTESVHAYNRRLLELQPDVVLAFKEDFAEDWRSPQCDAGTEHMCRIADAAGVPVLLNGERWIHSAGSDIPSPEGPPVTVTAGTTSMCAYRGDISKWWADAVVNAANSSLLGGGGVDGAIHRAAGPSLLEACREVVRRQGGCRTGEAVVTAAGNLRARFVIHTVGPVWDEATPAETLDGLLARCYSESLRLAVEQGACSIAFPCISTGVYRFPADRAAKIATRTVRAALEGGSPLMHVDFVCFSNRDLALYREALTAR